MNITAQKIISNFQLLPFLFLSPIVGHSAEYTLKDFWIKEGLIYKDVTNGFDAQFKVINNNSHSITLNGMVIAIHSSDDDYIKDCWVSYTPYTLAAHNEISTDQQFCTITAVGDYRIVAKILATNGDWHSLDYRTITVVKQDRPSVPSNLLASDDIYTDKIKITWNSISRANNYQLYRSNSSNDDSATLLKTTIKTSWEDTTAIAGTYYYYQLKACNESGCSNLSMHDQGRRKPAVTTPSIPSDLSASNDTYTDKIKITWSAVSGADSYQLYRSNEAKNKHEDSISYGAPVLIKTTTDTSWNDTMATVATYYYYQLKACDESGCSHFTDYVQGRKNIVIQDYELSLSKIGSGEVISSPLGISCGDSCYYDFSQETSVTLTATPTNGWTFIDWSGACSGNNTCVVNMTEPKNITATFTQNQSSDQYEPDNVSNTAKPITFNEEQIHSINPENDHDWVKFTLTEPSSFQLLVSGVNNGSNVNISLYDNKLSTFSNSVAIPSDTINIKEVTIYSCLPEGIYYARVSGVDNNIIPEYMLSLLNVKTCSTDRDEYEPDNDRETAKPIVSGDDQVHKIGHNDPDMVKFTLTEPSNLQLQTSKIAGGNIALMLYNDYNSDYYYSDDSSDGLYSTITFDCSNPLPNGIYYAYVYGRTSASSEYTLSLDTQPCSTQSYSLSIHKESEGGVISSNPSGISCGSGSCSHDFLQGTSVTLTATPFSINNWRFKSWSGACSGNDATCVVNMTESKSTTAIFTQTEQKNHTLFLAKTGNGAVSSNPSGISCGSGSCSYDFSQGTSVTLIAAPNNGWTFTDWGGACSGNGACIIDMTASKNVSVTFIQDQQPSDQYEPDNTRNTAKLIEPGYSQTHAIGYGDTDWVKFTLTEVSSLRLLTSAINGNDTKISLFNNNKELFSGSDEISLITYDCSNPLPVGTYYVLINGLGVTPSKYTLSLLDVNSCNGINNIVPIIPIIFNLLDSN